MSHPTPQVRRARVAGMFYPADPNGLAGTVDALLASAGVAGKTAVSVMLSPHAGYPYSGALAGRSFAAVDFSDVASVIMIGPSHVEPFDFTSVYAGDAYETPLGNVRVDTEIAALLDASGDDSIRAADAGHVQPRLPRGEHGIEVQLPFLQRCAPQVAVVPIVMGLQDWRRCTALGEALRTVLDRHPRTVILASSDLSHFYDYDTATKLDVTFCDTLATLDAQALYDATASGSCEACGAGPMIASLLALGDPATASFSLLGRSNSGDVTGDRSSVVGYASAIIRDGAS